MINLHTWVDRLISKQLWLLVFDDLWSLGWGFGCSDWCRGFFVLKSCRVISRQDEVVVLESPQRDSSHISFSDLNPLNVIQVSARIPSTWFESRHFCDLNPLNVIQVSEFVRFESPQRDSNLRIFPTWIPSTWFKSRHLSGFNPLNVIQISKFFRLESPQCDSRLGIYPVWIPSTWFKSRNFFDLNPLNVIQVSAFLRLESPQRDPSLRVWLARIPSTWFESYKFVVMDFCILVCNTGSSGSHLSSKEYSLVGCHQNSLDGPSWRALNFCSQGRPA
jgi:hypothetical protein